MSNSNNHARSKQKRKKLRLRNRLRSIYDRFMARIKRANNEPAKQQPVIGKGMAKSRAVPVREFFQDAAIVNGSDNVYGYGHMFDHGHALRLNQRQKRKRARAANKRVK